MTVPPPWAWTWCSPIPHPSQKTPHWPALLRIWPPLPPWCWLPRARRSTAATHRCGWTCCRCSACWTRAPRRAMRGWSPTTTSWCAAPQPPARALHSAWRSAPHGRRRCSPSTGSATGARAAPTTHARTTRRSRPACCRPASSRTRSCSWAAPRARPRSWRARRRTFSTRPLAPWAATGCSRAWNCRPRWWTTTCTAAGCAVCPKAGPGRCWLCLRPCCCGPAAGCTPRSPRR